MAATPMLDAYATRLVSPAKLKNIIGSNLYFTFHIWSLPVKKTSVFAVSLRNSRGYTGVFML